jgi:hypothetical protein
MKEVDKFTIQLNSMPSYSLNVMYCDDNDPILTYPRSLLIAPAVCPEIRE